VAEQSRTSRQADAKRSVECDPGVAPAVGLAPGHRIVAVALVSRERSQKAKALVRTEPSDAAIWLLPAFSGNLPLGLEST